MEALATAGATAVTNVATNAVTCSSIERIMNFKDNHKSLGIKVGELRALRADVERRVESAEDNGLVRTPVVSQWLDRVEEINQEVILILRDGSQQIEQRCCIVGCYPKSWWTCYKLGKKVSKMLLTVEELISKGTFDVVADNSGTNPVQVLPESQTVGQDELFDKVWKLLGGDDVKIMGIYGMGGVGKTTLLKKINNALCNETGKFDVVIWVVVSKEFSIRNVQEEIGRRLGFEWTEEQNQTKKAERIFNALRKKKFVVLLDDIWESMDLEAIGIPSPHNTPNKSKLVFTTRSEDVCGSMRFDKTVKVPMLDLDQAWKLFQDNVRQEALMSHPEIPELAQQVAEKCHGLPLALITIGRAMSSKKTLPEWKHAIKTLQKYASKFSGMEEKVFATLKFSYDNLEDDTIKNCFMYFSLYPEDYEVSKVDIIHQWIGEEGFLDDCEDLDDAINEGHDIIGRLKAACLLESGRNEEYFVKMHDVVRDLALWIAGDCGKKKGKFLVQAGVGLTRAPNIETWKEAERISLMYNDIRELAGAPDCPCLLTLLLQKNNPYLSSIAPDFFQYMCCLRVLDLSFSEITAVPKSIDGLLQLRFLNLSSSNIKKLPEELGNLVELRYLNLSYIDSFVGIPRGMISHFPRLQFLDFYYSGLWEDGYIGYPSVEELESLEHLRHLGITMREYPILSSMLLSPKLSSCITKVFIKYCGGLTKLASSILRNLKKLEVLKIEDCKEMEELEISSGKEDNNIQVLGSLKKLSLFDLPKLNIIWSETCTPPIHFKYLYYVDIDSCHGLRDLSWLVLVPFLKYLDISKCKEVEEIIVGEFPRTTVDNHTLFTRLESLVLRGLPKLKSICPAALPFPCLEDIYVDNCPLLKKLPFASDSTKKPLLKIYGSREWWDALQWEDQTAKSSFQPFFSKYPSWML